MRLQRKSLSVGHHTRQGFLIEVIDILIRFGHQELAIRLGDDLALSAESLDPQLLSCQFLPGAGGLARERR
jgi:hypothetical protein